MKTILTSMTLMAVLVLGAGLLQAGVSPAEAQHGHGGQAQSHFDMVAERLELTAEQREALMEPIERAMAAMQQLHVAHEEIAAELDDEQKQELAALFHEALGIPMPHGQRSEAHGEGHH